MELLKTIIVCLFAGCGAGLGTGFAGMRVIQFAFGGDDSALIGAGGHRRIGQIQDMGIGMLGMDAVKYPDKVFGGGATGAGQSAGGLVEVNDLLGGEGTVVDGSVVKGNVHGYHLDGITLGQFGSDISAGLGHKDNLTHNKNPLSRFEWNGAEVWFLYTS